MLALGEGLTTVLLITSLLLTAYQLLSRKKPKVASLDDALQSTATQGAFLPLVIGRQRLGPVFAFVEDTTAQVAALANQGPSPIQGKGNGGVPQQPSYYERALHLICVGPANELRGIYQNGELIWKGPINPQTAPSGTLFQVTSPNGDEGTFQVFWGFPDDPVIPGLAASPSHGIATNYPLAFKILWDSKNLGQSRQWPRLEYEVVCPCYSQIGLSPTEVPREGDDSLPLWGASLSVLKGNFYIAQDRQELSVIAYSASTRELMVVDVGTVENPGGQQGFHKTQFFDYLKQLSIVKLWTNDNAESMLLASQGSTLFPKFGDPTSSLLPNGQWKYFYVSSFRKEIPRTSGGLSTVVLVGSSFNFVRDVAILSLGAEVDESFLAKLSSAPPKYPSNQALGTSPDTGGIARLQVVEASNSDGVNPIHLIDQLLFAKYPYGAGKDRSKFDERSIEEAAILLQDEKIRGGIAVIDGEGLESVLAPLLTDISVQIVWDVEIGKHCFRPVRSSVPTADLSANAVLERPSMTAPTGNRVVDVIAFTFKDRQRNYRDVPLRLMDSGQVAEYESQRSRKVNIEITQDRDSVGRLMPRLQQTAFANQSVINWSANHAARLAASGSVFKSTEVEGPEQSFLITSVKRDINSSKVELETLLNVYQPPPLPENFETSSILPDSPQLPSGTFQSPQLAALAAYEMPKTLHSGGADVEMLFLAARKSGLTHSAMVWASRDGTAFQAVGFGVVAARGYLKRALSASGLSVEEVNIPIAAPLGELFGPTSSLSGDPLSWRAGAQLMIIGDEVVFVQEAVIESADEEEGEQQGYISGLIRGRAGTKQASHPIDTPFWIVQQASLQVIKNALFTLGLECQAKGQSIALRGVSNIAEVDAVPFDVEGKGFTPSAPVAVRLTTLLPGYPSGSGPITVTWGYAGGLFPKTAMGFQPLGTKIAVSPPQGDFLVEVLDKDSIVLHTEVATTNSVTWTLSQRTSFGIEYEENWKVRVTHRIGAFSSPPTILDLYPQ